MTRRILLIASNFPPVRGGSAVVYGNLAQQLADRLIGTGAAARLYRRAAADRLARA